MKDKNNGSFKPKKVYFSQVSNQALRDKGLSLKAKGLYALIQSYITIEGFILYKTTLRKSCQEGLSSFENSWKELKDKGYLIQHKIRGGNGMFIYEYELLDEPDHTRVIHTPKTQGVDNPLGGKLPLYNNTDIINTESNNISKELHPLQDACALSFIKAYRDFFDREHRRTNKIYPNLRLYEPEEIYDLAIEYFEEEQDIDKCTIDYFETIIDRFR